MRFIKNSIAIAIIIIRQGERLTVLLFLIGYRIWPIYRSRGIQCPDIFGMIKSLRRKTETVTAINTTYR